MTKLSNKIRTLLKGKDSKALIENFFSLTIFQFITMFLPLITLPYLIKVIGMEKYGIIIIAHSLILYFTTITEFSFGVSGTRDIASYRNDKARLNLIFSKVFLSQCLLLLCSFVIFLIIVFSFPKFRAEFLVYLFSFLSLIGRTLTPDWFFQGVEKMKYITLFNVLTRTIFVISIFLFIKSEADYYLHPLFLGIGSVLGGVISQYIIYKHFDIRLKAVGMSRIKQTLTANFGLFINQLLPQLYNNSTTFILGVMTNNVTVGLYGSLKQIVDFLVSLVRIVSRVFFPFLTRKPTYFTRFSTFFILGSAISIIPFILAVDFIMNFFNLRGDNSTAIFVVLLIGVPLLTMYLAYGTNYFLARRMDRIVVSNTLVSSLVGIILCFPLIHYFGALGAAINLTFCRGLMGGGLLLIFLKKRSESGL